MANILVVDDEEALRMLLQRQLQRAGHQVNGCSDGVEALVALENGRYDLVLSDMKMPRLDGMGLIRAARERDIKTDFIFLTGHGSLEGAVAAFKEGNVRDYLLKPLEDIQTLNVVVDRALERQRLVRLAEEDALTGLLNYRGIHERLAVAVESNPDQSVAVAMIDLDRFKYLNDLYGHPFGDEVLRSIADRLRSHFGRDAWIGRCGGDEFMVVLADSCGQSMATTAWAILDEANRVPIATPDGKRIPLSLCFGIADTNTVGRHPARILSAADVSLYQGKERGRGHVTVHGNPAPGQAPERNSDHPIAEIFGRLDRGSRDHSKQMAGIAVQLATRMGLSEDACDALEVAGLLHDIGKIAIPDSLLMKPGSLTPEEYETVKEHVVYSARIVKALPQIDHIVAGVAHHHERWDGKGYPNRLRETEIPLLARILSVADSFSAMITTRPYRPGMTIDEALAELERNAGTQFDPEVVAHFTAMVQASGEDEIRAAV
ncbi:MAG: HD domain-containing phosphohydrolase [Armatimonadota bacterium]